MTILLLASIESVDDILVKKKKKRKRLICITNKSAKILYCILSSSWMTIIFTVFFVLFFISFILYFEYIFFIHNPWRHTMGVYCNMVNRPGEKKCVDENDSPRSRLTSQSSLNLFISMSTIKKGWLYVHYIHILKWIVPALNNHLPDGDDCPGREL